MDKLSTSCLEGTKSFREQPDKLLIKSYGVLISILYNVTQFILSHLKCICTENFQNKVKGLRKVCFNVDIIQLCQRFPIRKLLCSPGAMVEKKHVNRLLWAKQIDICRAF